MRHLPTVIQGMLAFIPHTSVTLIRSLESIQRRAAYCAPEAMQPLWQEVSGALVLYLPSNPNDWLDWQHYVIKIWTGE